MPVHLTAEQRQLALRPKAPGPVVTGDRAPGGLLASGGGADRAAAPAAAGPPGPLGARTGAADAGRPGGDHPGRARRGVLHRDRRPAGEGDLHGVAGGGRGRRPGSVPGLAGAPARPPAGQAAQDPEAGPCPLAGRVSGWLAEWWSPVQISARLRIQFAGDPMMWVSHETIYQALDVQAVASCAGSWRAVCGPGGPSAAPGVAVSTAASCATW
jgi:hypothetical protein